MISYPLSERKSIISITSIINDFFLYLLSVEKITELNIPYNERLKKDHPCDDLTTVRKRSLDCSVIPTWLPHGQWKKVSLSRLGGSFFVV